MRLRYEWMFPHSALPALLDARGDQWRELVQRISTLDEEHEDSLGFMLMMVRLCGCATCQPGSFRLSLGCGTCAYRTVANSKGSDGQLIQNFYIARDEVITFVNMVREPQP